MKIDRIAPALLSTPFAIAAMLGTAEAGGATSAVAESYHLSRPASELSEASIESRAPIRGRINPLAGEADGGKRGTWNRTNVPPDPLAGPEGRAASRTPNLDLKFNGTGNPIACGGCLPPDTVGDVGPNHYIQMVNATKVAIYNKTGTRLKFFDLGDLWPSGDCTANAGDPIVLYDELANRWLLSQFQGTNDLCFAISQTPNPLGAYHLFEFGVGAFPDYFKVGVWKTGYYVGANEATYTAYAFNRTKMLAGDPTANFVKFTGQTNFLLPADVDGTVAPNSGGYFYTFKDDSFHTVPTDRIELFRLNPDFVTTANSTFSLIRTYNVAPFTYTPCGFFNLDCVAQPGTAEGLDAIGEWPMHRFAFRTRGSNEHLVGTFTVGAAPNGPGGTGEVGSVVRWFELRKVGAGSFGLRQQGTIDPADGHDRFMGSIAMDKKGNIGIGYSISSGAVNPGIRYRTRLATDPLGTMGPEKVLQAGGGVQTSTSNRWGDYSSTNVDPVTDCQFWHTNEWYAATSGSTWSTKIGAFTEPTC